MILSYNFCSSFISIPNLDFLSGERAQQKRSNVNME
jgi:hypothetical protein